MPVSLIVAMASNNVIGRDGGLPWHLGADLRRFKRLTMGHHILMGRKTYESIGRLLPGRKTVVITRQPEYLVPGASVVDSLTAALAVAEGDEESFVIGGAEIYQLALPVVDRIYLTRIDAEVEGDTFFPAIDGAEWQVVSEERVARDDRNDFDHCFQVLERVSRPAAGAVSDTCH